MTPRISLRISPRLPRFMQITWPMDNSGVRECGRSSVWLRLPHLSFLRRECAASSAPEWEDRRESGRCRRTIATIAASARCRSRDIAWFPLSPSGASYNGPPVVTLKPCSPFFCEKGAPAEADARRRICQRITSRVVLKGSLWAMAQGFGRQRGAVGAGFFNVL